MKRNAMNYIKQIIQVLFFAVILFVILGELFLPSENKTTYESNLFEAEWSQVLEDGSRIPISVPGQADVEKGEWLAIETVLPTDLSDRDWLCVRSSQQDMKIYVDGELRENYTTENSRPFGKNSVSAYVFIDLLEEDGGKVMTVETKSFSIYSGVINEFYYGDRMSIWVHIIKETGLTIILAFSLMLFAIVCMICSVLLSVQYKKVNQLGFLGAGIFLSAAWLVMESRLRQLLFPNLSVVGSVAFMLLMLLPFPFVLYINEIQKRRYQKLYVALDVVMFINMAVCVILQITNCKDFLETMFAIHGMIVIAIVVMMITLILDYRRGYWKEYEAVAIGFLGLTFSGIAELVLAYMKKQSMSGIALSIGLLFLMAMAFTKTGQEVLENEKKKEKALSASASKASFLANMSHEIRTPINSVIGMNEMILRECTEPEIKEYAYNIQSSSRILLGLVNDILDFSKIEAGQLQIVEGQYNPTDLFRDIIKELRNRADKKHLSIRLQIDKELPSGLIGDEIRIRQILLNLISNAVKFTTEGTITFSVQGIKNDDGTFVLKMSVADTGIGIRKEDIPKLFSSFTKLEDYRYISVEGSGIGLNIVKHLVDRMHGDMVVHSAPEKGSLFTISIPQQVVDEKPIGDLTKGVKEAEGRKAYKELFTAPEAKILVVDDNTMNLQVVKGLLKKTKVQIDTVEGGSECLEICAEKAYDLILMDHMMPEPDGIETLHLLREKTDNPNAKIPIIALTANAVSGVKELYLSEGFEDYLSKPIVPEELEGMLIKYLPDELVIKEQVLIEKNEPESKSAKQEEVQSEVKEEQKPEEQKVEEQSTEADKPAVDEIDMVKGMTYCANDKDMYYELLQMFCDQNVINTGKLEKYYEEKNWKDFSVLTHAIKSTSLGIGAAVFSEMAKQQEFAGKENREDFILETRDEFMNSYRIVKEKIQSILREAGALKEEVAEAPMPDNAEISFAEYESLLEKVQDFEMNEVIKQIDGMLDKTDEKEKEVLNSIKHAVEEFDYDTAEKVLSDWMQDMRTKKGE
ncbi:MAG: response regulator [Lachnospiraceae bacterium]|nr:response regulator [Lachnospiraceae bacterium]